MLVRILLASAVVGCGPKKPVQGPIDWGVTPRLPAPTASTYQNVVATPEDPVVARVVEGKKWDESLSGAAARLALGAVEGSGGMARWEVREAAWLAGYPYPIRRAKGWSTLLNAPPPDDFFTFLEQVGPGEDLGLVRARSPRGDAWVALVGGRRRDISSQQRVRPLGSTLHLEEMQGVSYQVADADGTVVAGVTPAQIPLSLTGEWLVRLTDEQGLVASFPLYVGITPPTEPLFDRGAETVVSDPEVARIRALRILGEVRSAYGVVAWEDDVLLGAAARQALAQPEAFHDPALAIWSCQGATVEDCVDEWVWSQEKRKTLLSPTLRYAGIAADWSSNGLFLIAVFPTE